MKKYWKGLLALLIIPTLLLTPVKVAANVKPIEDAQGKLEEITEEEKNVLNELFAVTQRIEGLEAEETELNQNIIDLQEQIANIQNEIVEKQKTYDEKLSVLEQVLAIYQRGGPASYLEILLNADSLSTFLKSINAIKDISHNVGDLLDTLKKENKVLNQEKEKLEDKEDQLQNTKDALAKNLEDSRQLKKQREEYLISLQEQRVHYEEYLGVLKSMWGDATQLFTQIVAEISRVVAEGYLTYEDLNMKAGLITMQGTIIQEEFNRILKDNSELPDDIFRFEDGEVVLEVPDLQLALHGNFVVDSKTAIRYEVTSGTFYEMPLDGISMKELFEQGPLLLDFGVIAGDMIIMDYTIRKVESTEGQLIFEIGLVW
jgi:peptidoglycan hydrolase CwlO-like protein